MDDIFGSTVTTLSDWLVAFAGSALFWPAVAAIVLLVLLAAARWMRWDRDTRARDAAHRRDLARRGARAEDV